MGIDIYLTTLEKPNILRLENAYGKDIASVLGDLKKINVLPMLDEQNINKELKNEYDIIINTHGDIDPYYDDTLCKNNAITYCHFPSAKFYLENEEKSYLEKHLKINRALTEKDIEETTLSKNNIKDNITERSYKNNFDKKRYLKWIKDTYNKMMQNTTLLTNSEYSRKAISDTYGIKDCIVLHPPVDVNRFCNSISTQYFYIEVDADPDQLFRILLNLVRNALQALESRDARDPGRDQIRITGRREGAVAVIEVSDTGPGLSDRARAHLFEAFQGSTRTGSVGLGLAIVAELVRAHGGDIRLVEGTIGATFRVSIPDRAVDINTRRGERTRATATDRV